ncbi:hypothetical protein CYMTET_14818 [Cymbomonas tetramitiformis]|uniref:K Homology domain-containing protein n=1 Tax=Cymbomonas tetramitiformis TaxID=36881 RepID=A0AAE0GFU8_9CHLO|nr:hypothetical protein CYMTET_14818 [Cymbomonas tetramitiformis]
MLLALSSGDINHCNDIAKTHFGSKVGVSDDLETNLIQRAGDCDELSATATILGAELTMGISELGAIVSSNAVNTEQRGKRLLLSTDESSTNPATKKLKTALVASSVIAPNGAAANATEQSVSVRNEPSVNGDGDGCNGTAVLPPASTNMTQAGSEHVASGNLGATAPVVIVNSLKHDSINGSLQQQHAAYYNPESAASMDDAMNGASAPCTPKTVVAGPSEASTPPLPSTPLGGCTFNAVKAATGATPTSSSGPPTPTPTVATTTTGAGSVLAASTATTVQQDTPVSSSKGDTGMKSLTMECPPSLVGKVIGKKGETIVRIQQVTGTSIEIERSGPPDVMRKLTVYGSDVAIKHAADLLTTLLANTLQHPPPHQGVHVVANKEAEPMEILDCPPGSKDVIDM